MKVPKPTMKRKTTLAAAVLFFAGLHSFASPVPNTLWFSGDPVYPPDWGNSATYTANAATHWQQFEVTDAEGWTVTNLFSVGQDFSDTQAGEWSIRTGMQPGDGGSVYASGTGSFTETSYTIRTL